MRERVTETAAVRRVTEDDWPLLRAIRLEMLRDTPEAYLETLDDALAEGETQWRFRARRGSSGPANIAIAAEDGRPSRWVAYLACFVDAPARAHLVSVYVAPSHRGTGLATRMVDRVAEWAHADAGTSSMHLYVHEDNRRAHAFYRRYGFTETGATMPYDLDPAKLEIEMAIGLPVPR